MIEVGSLVTLKSGGKTPLTVMSLKTGNGTESGRLSRAHREQGRRPSHNPETLGAAPIRLNPNPNH